MIKTVAIIGGTHGNEVTGVQLIKNIQSGVVSLEPDNVSVTTLLANPQAITENRRYLDRDLNRCFAHKDLENQALTGNENQLAKQLNEQLGPKGSPSPKVDFIVDLHTTTTAMGINIVIIQDDAFHLRLADFVQQQQAETTITFENLADHHFICSVAPKQILIEIGATPQGVLRQDVYEKTERTLKSVLAFIERYNQKTLPEPSPELEILEYFDVMYMPQDEHGNINGMIHSAIQDKDFSTLKRGDPIFTLFTGEEVVYQGDECIICFINEAAYYDEKKAFSMARKIIKVLQ